MNSSHHRWLLAQIPQWEKDNLLTPESAQTLRARYTLDESQPSVGQLIMGALGALLIGTGLIAVIGYNWDDFSRPVRLLFAFLPLLASQVFTFIVLKRGPTIAAWVKETAGLLQTLTLGACIAIVSQIYNLGGEWPEFLFGWMLLSLPLAWLLRSRAIVIFYLLAAAVWSFDQTERGHPWHHSPFMYPLLLLGILPYWPSWPLQKGLSLSVRWVLATSALVGLCCAATFAAQKSDFHFDEEASVWMWSLTAAIFVLCPLSKEGLQENTGRKPQVILGSLWLLGYGIAALFVDMGRHMLLASTEALKLPWGQGLLIALLAFSVVAVIQKRWAILSLSSLVLLPLLATPLAASGNESTAALSWLATLHLTLLGITLVALDFLGRPSAPRLGALLLCTLVLTRMGDSHLSMLSKGLGFIVVGIAFLAFNLFMSRRHKERSSQPTPSI